jgi:hypothetical protein
MVCGTPGFLGTLVRKQLSTLTGRNNSWWYAETDYSKLLAGWLTKARDFICAEPSKTRLPSFVTVTCVGGWRAERERQSVQQATEADWLMRANA